MPFLQAEGVPFEEYELTDQVEASSRACCLVLQPAAPACLALLRCSRAHMPVPHACQCSCRRARPDQPPPCPCATTLPQVLARIKAATGQATVPQIFVGGQLLGGASELLPLLQDGSLQRRLAATAAPPLPAELRELLQAAVAAGPAAAAADGERARLQPLASELRAALASGAAHTFTLQQAAQWLQQAKGLAPEAAAAALGQLQTAQLLAVAVPAGQPDAELPLSAQLVQQRPQLLLHLATDAPPPARWNEPLNGQCAWFGPARPAEEVRARMAPGLLYCELCAPPFVPAAPAAQPPG